jgi:NitT/TauT family transport system permease protein
MAGTAIYQGNSTPSSPVRTGFLVRHRNVFILISLLVALGLWQAAILIWKFPAFILPGPAAVWNRFLKALADGSLLLHAGYTLIEIICGLSIGSGMAMILGYLLAKSPTAERLLSPYLVASQAIPLVAVAPLLIIWFGPGMFSKILICSLTVFFPVLVNTVVGLRAVPANLRDLMSSLYADTGQVLRYLEIPAALPVFLGGLRIGATLSVIGAIVGEFVGSDRGLGFLINVSRGQYDTALVFVSIFTLILMALLLYGVVLLAEKRLLRWKKD